MTKDWCVAMPQGIRLAVQIMPNAKKNEVVGVLNGVLKIRLQARPIEGKANDALVRYLADALGLPKAMIAITHGHTSRQKTIEVRAGQLTADAVGNALLASVPY